MAGWNHMLMICEMFLFSLLARKFYRSLLQKRTDLESADGKYDDISNQGTTQNIIPPEIN